MSSYEELHLFGGGYADSCQESHEEEDEDAYAEFREDFDDD